MDLITAIKSGRPFKRKGQEGWFKKGTKTSGTFEDNCGYPCLLSVESVLADDWEIEEPKVEITESVLERAADNVMCRWMTDNTGNIDLTCRQFLLLLKSELFDKEK